MAADPAWYYRAPHGVAGPVSSADLKRLIEQRTIDPTTSIRQGERGHWFPAEKIYDAFIPVVEMDRSDGSDDGENESVEPRATADGEATEWYFSSQARRKLGPIPRSLVIAMVGQGRLKPIDLVWK